MREARVRDVVRNGHRDQELPPVVLARTTDRVGAAIDLLQLYGISQMPVSEAPDGDIAESIVGSVSEKGLLERTYRDPATVQRTVGEVMDKPLPTVDGPASLDTAFSLLSGGAPAVVMVDDGRAAGVVTKLDLLEYLAHRQSKE
jgi:cystathionine beta-synthase